MEKRIYWTKYHQTGYYGIELTECFRGDGRTDWFLTTSTGCEDYAGDTRPTTERIARFRDDVLEKKLSEITGLLDGNISVTEILSALRRAELV